MAIRQLRYGNDEILRKRCKEVPVVDDHIRQILEDMMETLHTMENGAALAANQLGILRRLVVIDYEDQFLQMVNPRIIESSGEQECVEGCLSFPEQYGITMRPQRVVVEALNERGERMVLTGDGEMAKCFCHELEHLDGIVFLDKVIELVE